MAWAVACNASARRESANGGGGSECHGSFEAVRSQIWQRIGLLSRFVRLKALFSDFVAGGF